MPNSDLEELDNLVIAPVPVANVQPRPSPIATLLHEHRRTLGGAALLGALIGGVLSLIMPSWYESTARLVVIPVDDPIMPSNGSPVEGANATLPMVAAVMVSRSVVDDTVARLHLVPGWAATPEAARRALMGHLTVTTDRRTNMVTVAAEDHQPERARLLVSTLSELANRRLVELWAAGIHAHRVKLEADLAQVSQQLAAAEEALRSFREANHVIDLPNQIKATVDEAAAIERQRIDKDMALHYLRGFGGSDAPEVGRAQRERQAAARALHALTRGPATDAALLPLESVPRLELELARLKRQVDVQTARFDLLSQKIGQLMTAEARPGGRAELVDPPTTARRPTRPTRKLVCLEGAAAAALLAALWLLWRARSEQRPPHLV